MTKKIFKYIIGCSLFIHLGACSSFQNNDYLLLLYILQSFALCK
jgi:hypothetical protein